jgi:acetyltransferase
VLRPIRPEDADALQAFIRGLSEQSRYMRFVSAMRELTPHMLARYTQVDYHRELALVAVTQLPNPAHRGHPQTSIVGFAHYLRNADGRGAEYALVIGDAWQRRGLGRALMQALIEAAREQGLEYIDGFVLAANHPMLALMSRLGFTAERDGDDATMRKVWLALASKSA